MTGWRSGRNGLSSLAAVVIVLLLALFVVSVVYIDSTQGTADQVSQLTSEVSQLSSNQQKLLNSSFFTQKNLPVMNQPPTIRTIRETWYLSPSAHQDRFDPSFIVVNQGDTIQLTFIDNDTVAHDFVIGPPYSIVVNATVPGLINDLTGQVFTTPARNNSPGVVVKGIPGNVSATYSFVAQYSGIFEFVCTYHASIGMIGYLVVLPNLAYGSATISTTQTVAGKPTTSVAVSIVPGAGTNTSSKGYSPDTITVVLGVNNTVTWTNADSAPHTVTANDGTFYSGNIATSGSFTYTFTTPGTYDYHCTYHPWMTGAVIVKAGT